MPSNWSSLLCASPFVIFPVYNLKDLSLRMHLGLYEAQMHMGALIGLHYLLQLWRILVSPLCMKRLK